MSGPICKCGHYATSHSSIPGDQVSEGCEGRMSDDKGWCLCTYSCSEVELVELREKNAVMLEALQLWDQGFAEGEEFTSAQFTEWVNKNRRAARAAIQKATGAQ